MSFLAGELENDPAAEYYFGRIECPAIDDLAEEYNDRLEAGKSHPPENPIFIFDPNRRDGLQEQHPFTKALYQKPIEILKAEFHKHKEAERHRRKQVEAKETTDRLKRLAREASKFMREKLEEAGVLGAGEEVRTKSFAVKGVGIAPAFTQIEVGASRTFTVRASRSLGLPAGTVVKVLLSKAAGRVLEVVGPPVDLEPDPVHDDLLRGLFTLRGAAFSGTVQVGGQVDSLDPVYAEVQVVEPGPTEVEIADGFAFQRKNYTVRPGARKKLLIRARFDRPVAEPPSISFSVGDGSVIALRQRTPFELVEGATYYEASVTVEGKQVNGKTRITANLDGRMTSCGVAVLPREEEGIELSFKLVDYPLGKSWRATWEREEPNKLLITTTHESIRRYLGDEAAGYPGQQSEAFRVLLAELISDNVCRRIVQEHAQALPMEFDSERVYQLHNQFMREFTPIAHRTQLPSPTV